MPRHIGASILVAIPAAFIVAALVGMLIERTIIRFLYGRPLETLLADLRHQPGAAAARAIDLLGPQPIGRRRRRG